MNKQQNLKTSVIGVDLGSSAIKIAAVDHGTVDIITNQANLRSTPNVVGYGQAERLIGELGYAKMKSNVANTVVAPTRLLGVRQSEFFQAQTRFSPSNPVISEDGSISFEVNCQGNRQKLVPQQITAAILRKVQQIITLNKLQNKQMVLTVPNYWTHHQKQALLRSIQILQQTSNAKFGVKLIKESQAVGLDYGFYKKNEFPLKEQEAKSIMFVDFGHSKLSVYVIQFTKNYQKIVYQKDLRQLGCKNLDQVVFNFYQNIFENQNKDLEITIKQNKKATIKLMDAIQKQRKVLSGNSDYDFNIECLLEDKDISYNMKRQQFEEICQPVLSKIISFFEEMKNQIQSKNITVSTIQLIGGGTRIPVFLKKVAQVFGMQPCRTLNSSECVARGAALSAALTSSLFRAHSYHTVDISHQKVVLSWKGQQEQMENQANQLTIYEKGESIFATKEVQIDLSTDKKVNIFTIYYEFLIPGIPTQICSFKLKFQDDSPFSKKLKFLFQLDQNQMINKVTAFEKIQKSEKKIEEFIFSVNYNQKQMQAFIKKQKNQMLRDRQIVEGYQKKNIFQSSIYALKDQFSSFIDKKQNKQYADTQSVAQIYKMFDELQEKFDQIVNYDHVIRQTQQKCQIFTKHVQNTKKRFEFIEKQFEDFENYIKDLLQGKVKGLRFYPKEAVEQAIQWIKNVKQSQKTKKKYETHTTSIDQIRQRWQQLSSAITQFQVSQQRRQRNIPQQQYQRPQRGYQPNFYNNQSSFNPFVGTPNQRRARNNTSNGFFPGFSFF